MSAPVAFPPNRPSKIKGQKKYKIMKYNTTMGKKQNLRNKMHSVRLA